MTAALTIMGTIEPHMKQKTHGIAARLRTPDDTCFDLIAFGTVARVLAAVPAGRSALVNGNCCTPEGRSHLQIRVHGLSYANGFLNDVNHATVIGTLTDKPVIKNGRMGLHATAHLAIDYGNRTCPLAIQAWDSRAEELAHCLVDDQVLITGQLKQYTRVKKEPQQIGTAATIT